MTFTVLYISPSDQKKTGKLDCYSIQHDYEVRQISPERLFSASVSSSESWSSPSVVSSSSSSSRAPRACTINALSYAQVERGFINSAHFNPLELFYRGKRVEETLNHLILTKNYLIPQLITCIRRKTSRKCDKMSKWCALAHAPVALHAPQVFGHHSSALNHPHHSFSYHCPIYWRQ